MDMLKISALVCIRREKRNKMRSLSSSTFNEGNTISSAAISSRLCAP